MGGGLAATNATANKENNESVTNLGNMENDKAGVGDGKIPVRQGKLARTKERRVHPAQTAIRIYLDSPH
jgi:hypothetical protein